MWSKDRDLCSPSSRIPPRLNISFSTDMHNWGVRVPLLKVMLPYWAGCIINVCSAHREDVGGLFLEIWKSLCRFKFCRTLKLIFLHKWACWQYLMQQKGSKMTNPPLFHSFKQVKRMKLILGMILMQYNQLTLGSSSSPAFRASPRPAAPSRAVINPVQSCSFRHALIAALCVSLNDRQFVTAAFLTNLSSSAPLHSPHSFSPPLLLFVHHPLPF